jgi:K+-transporting ATPase ATPase C chain
MKEIIRPAVGLLALFTVLCGLVYPALVTGAGQLLFPGEANGSLVIVDGERVGSALIGQPFTSTGTSTSTSTSTSREPGYFWGRPSATSTAPCDAAASSGSNLGPSNPALREAVSARAKALRDADPGNRAPVPVDLVTASGSGLDPHLSPAAALYQVRRVARARGLPEASVRRLVEQHVEERTLGVLGEPRVNVLRLNLALDRLAGGALR